MTGSKIDGRATWRDEKEKEFEELQKIEKPELRILFR